MKYYTIGQTGITLKNMNKQSRFHKEMFHGNFIYTDGLDTYYKNTFVVGKIAKPGFDFVVCDEVYELLKSYQFLKLKKIERLKLFNFSFINNRNQEFNYKLSKEPDCSDYFEKLTLISPVGYEFYETRLVSMDEENESVSVVIKELDNWTMKFDKTKMSNLEKYKVFKYGKISFFNEEIYAIIKPHLNMDFFEVVEVDIPV